MNCRRFQYLLVLAMGTALALPPAASLAQRRKRPAKTKDVDLGKKQEAGIDLSLQEDLTREKVEERDERPVLRFEQFRRTVELQVAAKRAEQIDTLSRIVALGPSDEEAPSLLFRLAELYWEEAKFFFFRANALDDDMIALKGKGNQREIARLKVEQEQLMVVSEEFRGKAIDSYRVIVRKHRDYERLDEVLYSLGSNRWERGERKQALKVYKALIRKFPDSEYLPDAYLAFGEHYFAEGEVRSALKAYKRAATYTESKVYGFAMYKQGWCYYNLGRFEESLDLFKAVIFYGELTETTTGQNKLALIREARRDYVLSYSHVGSPKAAKQDFEAIGGDESFKMLTSLAEHYYNSGKDRESIIAFRTLIKERPLAPDSPGYQAKIVDAAQRIGNKRYTVKQTRLLTRLFKAVEEANVAKTDKDKEKLADARVFAERTLRTLAVTWHSEAKKTRDDPTFFLALELYSDYVTLFPSTKFEYDMRFYFAELLYHLERFPEAAQQYTNALLIDGERIAGKRKDEKGKVEKPGKFLVQAAFNSILAYEEVVKAFEETEERAAASPDEVLPIPPPKQALIDACNRYLEYVPRGDKVVEVRFKVANIYYRYNRFDEATPVFSEIALEHPGHDLAEYSANLVLDSYNLLDNPTKVNEWARRFRANRKLAKGAFGKELLRVIEDSALTMVEAVTRSGDHAQAANAYEGFVKEFPNSKKADKALYNASVEWANAKALDRALGLRARIIKEYPKSDLVPESIFTTAAGYESVADFKQAVRYYEQYANRFFAQRGDTGNGKKGKKKRGKRGRRKPKAADDGPRFQEAKAKEALYNSAILREGLGNLGKSRAHRLKYIDTWPKSKDSKDLFLSIVDLYEREGNTAKAVQQLEDYLAEYASKDPDRVLLFRLRMAKMWEKSRHRKSKQYAQGKYDQIRTYHQALKKRKKKRRPKLKGGLLAVATVELQDLDPARMEYEKLSLEYPWVGKKKPKELFGFLENVENMDIKTQRQLNRVKKQIKETTDALKSGVAAANKKFQRSLKKKTEALKSISGKYTKIVEYKQGEPALCALEKIGGLYLNYIKTLKRAPPPPYLQNEEQELTYRGNLDQESLPVEDKAVEAFSAAVNKSRELMLYTPCARRSLRKLRKLRPDEWPKLVELRMKSRASPAKRFGADFLMEIQPVPKRAARGGELPDDVRTAPPPEKTGPAKRKSAPREELPAPDEDEPGRSSDGGEPSLEDVFAEPDDSELLR